MVADLLRLARTNGTGGRWIQGVRPALGGCAGLLLVLVVAAAWIAWVNASGLRNVAHIYAAQDELNSVVLATTSAETGQRGFLLTGDETYLEPYNRAVADLPPLLGRLEKAVSRESDPSAALGRLRDLIAAKLAELERTVTLARGGDRAGALALVNSGKGLTLTAEIAEAAAALRGKQDVDWARSSRAVQRREGLLVVLDAVGALLVALLAWLAGRVFQRGLRVLRQAESSLKLAYDTVRRNNADLESEVARRTADLRAANDEIQRFAYIVSHDLRAPLVSIMGFTGELETAVKTLRRHVAVLATADGALPADLEEAIEQDLPEAIQFIRSSTGKMDRLIGAILRLSREGRRLLQPERIAMGDVVRNALEALAHQVQQAGAEVEVDALPDLVSDRLAVEQVVTNLIDNALKYRDPGRPLRLAVRGRSEPGPHSEMRVYEIEDTGRGIAERDRERVFELFRRAGGQDVPGEGVGLAHVRALVRRLGGRIALESTPGRGSTFRLHLPAALEPALESAA